MPHKELVDRMFKHQLHTNRANLFAWPPEMDEVVAAYDATVAKLRSIQRENEQVDKLLDSLGGIA